MAITLKFSSSLHDSLRFFFIFLKNDVSRKWAKNSDKERERGESISLGWIEATLASLRNAFRDKSPWRERVRAVISRRHALNRGEPIFMQDRCVRRFLVGAKDAVIAALLEGHSVRSLDPPCWLGARGPRGRRCAMLGANYTASGFDCDASSVRNLQMDSLDSMNFSHRIRDNYCRFHAHSMITPFSERSAAQRARVTHSSGRRASVAPEPKQMEMIFRTACGNKSRKSMSIAFGSRDDCAGERGCSELHFTSLCLLLALSASLAPASNRLANNVT